MLIKLTDRCTMCCAHCLDDAREDADGVRGHIKLWKEEFLDNAGEFVEQYILNHDNIDIFEMVDDFRKSMEEYYG